MISSIGSVLTGDFSMELKKYKNEYLELIEANNNRCCQVLAKILIPINIALIGIDLFVYRPMWNNIPSYIYLFYSHIIVIVLFSLWLTLLNLNKGYNWLTKKHAFNNSFFYLVICWCTFMGVNSTKICGQISAYVICMFCCSVLFYLRPVEALLTYIISFIIFSIGLIAFIPTEQLLYSSLVNASFTTVLSIIVSITNYSSLVKDFLYKKQLYENKMELQMANEKLNEYEKLRTDFFANISHELRTPLNVIYSAKQMIEVSLKKNNFEDANVNKYLKMVTQNSHRLLRLINNLIDITKIDGSSFEVNLVNADIIKTVEDIVMSVAAFVENKGLTLTFDTEIEERIISCDPDKIERIILNLLSNAIKFTQEEGSIFVNIYLEDNNICISVKDSGIGIPEEMQDLIFQRFVQVDKSTTRRREGSGIGLSLVKSLVEMHGGKISVKSNLGKGTEFIVSLPDKKLPDNEEVLTSLDLAESHIDRINIEFSDIYR